MKRRPLRAALRGTFAGLLLLLAGCASATSSPSEDTGAGDTRDSGSDAADAALIDSGLVDTTEDTAVADTAVEPDTLSDICPDGLAGECESRTIRCTADRLAYETCGRCGNLVNTTICGDGQICDDSSGLAECRACLSGECTSEAACPPNTSQCADYRTAVTCRADGSIDLRTQCPGGGRCVDGGCRSRGTATATGCNANTDCLGALCLCGADGADLTAECSSAALTGGYCSTVDCMTNGCDPTGELCVDFGVTGSFGGADLCVVRGGCTADQLPGAACGGAGFACTELPTHARPTDRAVWRPACWPASIKPIGAECSSDAECVGGLCLTRDLAGSAVSYCSASCGEAADCPSYAACMRDPRAAAGVFLCMAKTEFCPRIQSGTRAQIDGLRLEFFDVADQADTTTVCYFAE